MKRNGERGYCRLFLFLLLSCLLGASLSQAQMSGKSGENEVLAIGTGAIVDGNLALAKQNAISRALMKGLETYLLRRLGSQTAVNSFQRIVQEIIPGAREKIENFHILAEDQIADNYRVLVRLRVNEEIMDQGLREAGIVLLEGTPLEVLFLVSESREGRPSYWWRDPEIHSELTSVELALHKVFQERGFRPINRTSSLPDAEFTGNLRSLHLDDKDILRWGQLFLADVVIYGDADIADEEFVSLILKAVDVNKGIQICQGNQTERIGKGIEGQEQMIITLEQVVKVLATRLAPTIIQMAASDYERGSRLEITLKGLSSFKQFRTFVDFLKRDVAGVKSVKQTRVRKNAISIAVEFQGDKNVFLGRVLTHENLPLPVDFDETQKGEIMLIVEQPIM